MVFAPSMMQKLSGNAVDSDASPCKSWSFSFAGEDFVATPAPSPSADDDALTITLFLLVAMLIPALQSLFLLLVIARILDLEEGDEEDARRKVTDWEEEEEEEVEEEDITRLA